MTENNKNLNKLFEIKIDKQKRILVTCGGIEKSIEVILESKYSNLHEVLKTKKIEFNAPEIGSICESFCLLENVTQKSISWTFKRQEGSFHILFFLFYFILLLITYYFLF